MAGGYYTALSGMRTRMDALDRIASDIANASTAGYKTERGTTTEAHRPTFGAALQAAVDVTTGSTQVDLRPGALVPTNRPMDLAIEGAGFFAVDTPQGTRYTRNGHLNRRADGMLANEEGDAILGANGPIPIGSGEVQVDADGTVRSGGAIAGTLKIVDFAPGVKLEKEGGSRFRTDATPLAVEHPVVTAGSLEQSNVSVVDRIAEMTEVSRNYDTLLRGVTVLMNDIDRGAISELGRR
jgi:flagellar basal-body rod protein FlgF